MAVPLPVAELLYRTYIKLVLSERPKDRQLADAAFTAVTETVHHYGTGNAPVAVGNAVQKAIYEVRGVLSGSAAVVRSVEEQADNDILAIAEIKRKLEAAS